MRSRNVFAAILMACLLSVGLGGMTSTADAASAGQSVLKSGQGAGKLVVEAKHRYRSYYGPRAVFRIGPSYSGYDYPYYYNRGYYPTHIGPGYVYNYPVYAYSYRETSY